MIMLYRNSPTIKLYLQIVWKSFDKLSNKCNSKIFFKNAQKVNSFFLFQRINCNLIKKIIKQFWLFIIESLAQECRLTTTCSNVRRRCSSRRATSSIITTTWTPTTWTACWTVPSAESVSTTATIWWSALPVLAAATTTPSTAWTTCSPTNKKIKSFPIVRWHPNWTCRRWTSRGWTASFPITTATVDLTASSPPLSTWVFKRSVFVFFSFYFFVFFVLKRNEKQQKLVVVDVHSFIHSLTKPFAHSFWFSCLSLSLSLCSR